VAKSCNFFPRFVSRRDFLTLVSSGVTLKVAGRPVKSDIANARSVAESSENKLSESSGITTENFNKARKRAAAMVAKLSLAEKISQFGSDAPAIPRVGLPAFNYYAGEALHGLNHSGPVTAFPVPLALGCSWNRSLIHRVFTAVSDEIWAWHKKNGQGLAMFSPPTVNMGTRDPRWGRIAENYSEDPYLVGQMAIHTIRGMQGNDPRYLKTIACAKHFIANDTEADRETTSAAVDSRSFWEFYSRGFEVCVKEGQVFTVMSSYNALNGIPTTASRFLLTDLLRERWGFRGYVVSDCDAIGDICRTHHFVPTFAEAAALAVNAGCDINCGDTLPKHLGEAVDKMLIGEAALDQSLVRSFTGRVLLGEFDPPEQIPYNSIPTSCLNNPAHQELAREAARQSIVLFKNENRTLPLDKTRLKRIAVIGPMADVCNLGNYSGTPWMRVSPLQGIKNHLGIPTGPSYQKRASDLSRAASSSEGGPFGEGSLGPRIGWCSEGGEAISFISDKSWAAYEGVLFTGANKFHARVASGSAEGTIEVHVDSLDGPPVAELKVSKTGGGQKWVDVSASFPPIRGVHTVFLRFLGGPLNLFSAFSVQSFGLTPESEAPPVRSGLVDVVYAVGCGVTGEKDPAHFAAAINAAKEADVALVFVGSDERVDGETVDRDHIHLPGVQHELVQAIYAANPRTVLVISSNCPVAVNWEQDHLPAIVGGLCLGEQQGHALADALFGVYNPGGKLSTTWYRGIDDLPNFHDYNVRHGRTYMYFQGKPLYPFGHGLSYTAFQYGNLRISAKTLNLGGKVTVLADVTNSGSSEGDEIAQFYIHVVGGSVLRPNKQLVGFDRVHLKAGETRTLSLEFAHEERALRYWDESKNKFILQPGAVEIMVGASSADIRLKGQVQLAGEL
jgi:beta-glucosidase